MDIEPAHHSPIPPKWRKTVCSILRAGRKSEILVRKRPQEDFSALFPDAWAYQRNDAMARALDGPTVMGALKTGMLEPGETWAFWFHFREKKLYGKINLTPTGKLIIIYSAHLPNKGETHL